MDWSTLFSTLFVIVFIVLMLRGCGGMTAGGGCGMHMRHRPRRDHPQPPTEAASGPTSTRERIH